MKASIKNKMIIGYSIIFLVSYVTFNYFITATINNDNKRIIVKELKDIKNTADSYINQFLLINDLTASKETFLSRGEQVSTELASKMDMQAYSYSVTGKLLISTDDINIPEDSKTDDLNLAVNGKTSYTINHSQGVTIISFSYPLIVKGNNIGIIRFIKDYSDMYNSSKRLIILIRVYSFILFIAIFIFSLFISMKITLPIIKLNYQTKKLARGNYDIDIGYDSNDEIGELSRSFVYMARKIEKQIEIIKNDRDKLMQLNNYRKTFLDNVTHELKTPLTTILGYAQALLYEDMREDDEFFNKSLRNIYSESKRLHRMVLDLLHLSLEENSDEYVDFRAINISNILRETCEQMQMKANRYKNNIKVEIQPDIIIYGIEDKIKQVFINIIDNSIKYGNTNTPILVTAQKYTEITKIEIEDMGIGISEDKLNKIFEPFFRENVKKSREEGSSGIGLSIVKSIVNKHNGVIDVESKIGNGTRITIEFNLLNDKETCNFELPINYN